MKTTLRTLLVVLYLTTLCHAQGEEKPSWDVSDPPGPASEVKLETERGTWLSLDLSPDGKLIAFDLLGDLYLLDVNGGQARSLTSGMEWDMQPTFSPDGQRLAFTSDRGGGDNIWVMDLASGEKSSRAITSESFRLLNQPTWSPDGKVLAGRKHFTGTRSLGAGEIWAYHLDGGSGVRLTKRANDQLDLGEPAYSPDGRYLYYSLDATGGKRFQYNKDVNKGIYAIERLDTVTGEKERLLSGSGGACAPQPSPDGKSLSFVRRVRGKSQLVVLDLEDRAERVLFDGLERDMQETWAVHGVYSRYSWTPDSQEIIIWAQGRFWRISATGEKSPQEIPFRVSDTRQVRQAVRFPVEVAPKAPEVKALSSPHASPSGRRTTFAALGRVWIREGKQKPRALNSEEGNQAQPRFVKENEVLYTNWRDDALGSIRLQKLDGDTEVLVQDGRFADPVLSQDGRYLAYRKLSHDFLFDRRHSQKPGLYLKDRRTGETRRLSKSGYSPHFTESDSVLYYTTGYHPSKLVRHDLRSGETLELYEGQFVTQFLLSPDETTLAFQDGFSLVVVPHVPTGRKVGVSLGRKNLPAERISTEVGAYFPSWSEGGQLLWNVGAQVWSYRPGSKSATSTDFSWSYEPDTPGQDSWVALVGGKVVTMKGDEILQGGTVLIHNNRIAEVGPASSVSVPSGAKVINCEGKTVLPGLIDVHWHGSFSNTNTFPEVNYAALSSLSFGVTTLHDPSNDTASVFTAKEMQTAGRLLAPRIFSTGTILYGAKAPGYYAQVDSLQDALGHLKRLKAWGAVSVKSYNQPRREQRQQVLEAARQTRMMVVPEGGSLYQHNMTMVVDGHTGVEHALPVPHVYNDVVDLWSQTKVGYTPTLGVAYGGIWGENFWYVKTDVWEDERLNRFVPREVIDPDSRRRMAAPDDEYNHKNASAGATALERAGVKVNLGAHGQREGLAAHWELWMLQQGGMTPHEALRCGTLNGAEYLGMGADLGSLEPGKLADVIVVDGDPLSDIRQSKFVELTIQGGRVYESSSMKSIAPELGAEPKLWWRE